MTSSNTGRFQWPIPPWNADWQKWQAQFGNFAAGVDATAFALLEHLTIIHHTLPIVEIAVVGPNRYFTQTAAAVFISRTAQVQISVGPTAAPGLALAVGGLIGASIQPGAIGPQAVDWEIYTSQTDIDSGIMVFGIVNADFSITWFNGNRLSVTVPTILFQGSSGSPPPAMISGAGNPNGIVGPNIAGTPYQDVLTGLIYMNIDGATAWQVIG